MDADARILWHLQEGRKLEAVKVYKETRVCSLKEAVREVEKLQAELASGSVVSSVPKEKDPPTSGKLIGLESEVISLLKAGRKLEAVKAWKEATDASLLESKMEVERIEAGLAQDPARADQEVTGQTAVLDHEIIQLLGRGESTAAVDLVIDRKAVSTPVAIQYVQALADQNGFRIKVRRARWPLGTIILAIFAFAIVTVVTLKYLEII